jgi:protein involved in polysaccharide export with SLBB domain
MRIRLVAAAVLLLLAHISLFAQNMPWLPVPKLGKLVPGDTLRIGIFRPREDKLDGVWNLTLTVGVLDDGTISVPELGKVPAGGLSIIELNSTLQQRYTEAFLNLPFTLPTSTPPHVTVGYLGHSGGTGLDKLIARIGKSSTGR